MKVTVCFGSTRIVVPSGDREFKVKDLIKKAVIRYRKATDKPPANLVIVHNLLQLDGGILDPDDRICDVVDDREQLIAIFDETETKPHPGDGTSSSGHSENQSPNFFKNLDESVEADPGNGIQITGEELQGTPPSLHVRRGSEPALNRLSPIPPCVRIPPDLSKRWSAAPIIDDHMPQSSTPRKNKALHLSSDYEESPCEEDPGERSEGSGEEKLARFPSGTSQQSAPAHHTRFSRDGNRCSIQFLSDNSGANRWADAADRAIEVGQIYGESGATRQEPVGGSASPSGSPEQNIDEIAMSSVLVCLSNDGSPLGIHVIPSTDRSGVDQGLLVEGIESDGRVARDGNIQIHDIIVEINKKSLKCVTFHQAQEIFKESMSDPELRLRILKRSSEVHLRSSLRRTDIFSRVKSKSSHSPSTFSSRAQAVLLHSNTRRIGKRLAVNLRKGTHGLGFSITTRDNPAGGEAPIYIKNILTKGAAIEEGTLRIGDRLLEVNGVQVTGHSQSEIATLLRQIPVGEMASIVVSRQQKVTEVSAGHEECSREHSEMRSKSVSPKLPRHLPSEKVPEDSLVFPWKQRAIFTFEIPVHDTERAGLGVSVKGKTSSGPNGNIDLGIFVKNVIHGGAASRDGRLLQNDQLVNINGLSLLGKSNSEAMKTLRTAMHHEYRLRLLSAHSGSTANEDMGDAASKTDSVVSQTSSNQSRYNKLNQELSGPSPGKITLTIARRSDVRQRDASLLDYSGTSLTSERTATLPFKKGNSSSDRSVDGYIIDSAMNTNPVVQRLMGSDNKNLRNESYYKATHDTWNSSQLPQMYESDRDGIVINTQSDFTSPTVNRPANDTVLIHDEYNTPMERSSFDESVAGFSRDQFGRQSMSEKRHATLDAKSTDTYQRSKKAREERDKQKREMQDEMLRSSEKRELSPAKTVLRELPIDVPSNVNFRDQSDRATSNVFPVAKQYNDNYLMNDSLPHGVSLEDSMPNDRRTTYSPSLDKLKFLSRFPQLNWSSGKALTMPSPSILRSGEQLPRDEHPITKTLERTPKNGSRVSFERVRHLERIPHQNNTHESKQRENKKAPKATFGQELSAFINSWGGAGDPNRNKKGAGGPSLGMRKSSSLESLQTMVQEIELEEDSVRRIGSGRVPRGRVCNESFRAAVDRSYDASTLIEAKPMETVTEEESESGGSAFGRGTSCHSSMSSSVEGKYKVRSKKRQKILKGLGSVFRFSKNRKSLDSATMSLAEEVDTSERRNPNIQNELIDERSRAFSSNYAETSDANVVTDNDGVSVPDEEKMVRSERMHQLRAEHQRKHAKRNGVYPNDESEDRDKHIGHQRMESQPAEPKAEIQHWRSRSHDHYSDSRRRKDPFADPNKFSHYVNYEQIQMHLHKNKEQERLAKLASQQYQDFRDKQTSREQREYQSQRSARECPQPQRPVSNYFEYESVQTIMKNASKGQPHPSAFSLPRRPHNQGDRDQGRGTRQRSKSPLQHIQAPNSQANAAYNKQIKIHNSSLPKNSTQGRFASPPKYWYGQDPNPPHRSGEDMFSEANYRPVASTASLLGSYHHPSITIAGSKV